MNLDLWLNDNQYISNVHYDIPGIKSGKTLDGVRIIKYKKLNDNNLGNMYVAYNSNSPEIVQVNVAYNLPNSIKGLHMQSLSNPQSRLVSSMFGDLYVVAVDMRFESETFGDYVLFQCNHYSREALYAPGGFAWGIMAKAGENAAMYLMDAIFNPEYSIKIDYKDKFLNINWGLSSPNLSFSDLNETISFEEYKKNRNKYYEYAI